MYMREGIEAVTFQMQEPLCVVSPFRQVPPVSYGSQLRSGIPLLVAVVVLGGTSRMRLGQMLVCLHQI